MFRHAANIRAPARVSKCVQILWVIVYKSSWVLITSIHLARRLRALTYFNPRIDHRNPLRTPKVESPPQNGAGGEKGMIAA
eukprot:9116185-Pyramimonas_sp.AAC.1